MITRNDLATSMGKLIVKINDYEKFPDVSVSLEKDGEEFTLAIVELDEFDKDDMSVAIKVFGDPRHNAPTEEVAVFNDTLEKCVSIRAKRRECGTVV